MIGTTIGKERRHKSQSWSLRSLAPPTSSAVRSLSYDDNGNLLSNGQRTLTRDVTFVFQSPR